MEKNNDANLSAKSKAKQRNIVLCLLLMVHLVNAQSSFLDSLQASFIRYKNEAPEEKVFVHTDKSFYLTGETMWFKAYIVNASTNRPSAISKVVYVELLDGKAKPVLQAMIENRQSADGSFVLPASLNSGTYTLRAYTAWMKNFDDAFFFQTPIQIVNTTRRPDWASLEAKEEYAVQFFPEGGNMVEGLQIKVGFQLVNQYGQGVSGDGFVIKNGKDTVVHFRPLKFGIGNFLFTPENGANYKALVRLPNGQTLSASLPAVYKEGYVLQVEDATKEQVKITVATGKNFLGSPVYLLTHAGAEIKFAATKFITSGKVEWVIDKARLADGINVITLFDAARKPVCERLFFKKPSAKLAIELNTDQREYTRRSAVRLNISAQDQSGKVPPANLSVSVFLLDSLQGLTQPAIESYLWLSAEVKGTIENLAYYFTNDDEETKQALDNLLLTQGWRRFAWHDVVANKQPSFSFLPEYEGTIIKGKVINKASGAAVPNVLCFLSVPGEKFFTANAVSDQTGEVRFPTKDIYGPVELAVQADGADSTLRVDLQSSFFESPPFAKALPFKLLKEWSEQLAQRHLNAQATISFATPAALRYSLPPQTDTLPFYGRSDKRYVLDEFTRFPSMEEVMREITAEVYVNKRRDSFRYSVLNLPYKVHFDETPLVLFDGVPVFNANKIIAYDPLKVKRIDVVARKYFWGNTVNSGIVSYATYEGNLAGFELDPGVLLTEYNGLQVKREFYSPVYKTTEQVRSREPDRRNVLFWAPAIRTTSSGKGEIEFYTSDVRGKYAVSVQGISDDGLPGSRILTFDVK